MKTAKLLVVGDPHVRTEDLEECQHLAALVLKTAIETKPDFILVTGDLYHNHDIVHCGVMDFWRQTLAAWAKRGFGIILIKGNHDAPHDAPAGVHALVAHAEQRNVTVIDKPQVIEWGGWQNRKCSVCLEPQFESPGGDVCKNGHRRADPVWEEFTCKLLMIPYLKSTDEYIAACKQYAHVNTVYCHQTFNGAQYDNGFYDPGGLEPDKIPQKTVISGHIHTGQEFDKVWYIGSPRWLTISEANQDKFIWLIEHNSEGQVISRQAFPTDTACRKIVKVTDDYAAPLDPETMDPRWRVLVDIQGPDAWIAERREVWRGRARVTAVPTGAKAKIVVRESDGIGKAFSKYLSGFKAPGGTPTAVLAKMCQERLSLGGEL